MMMNWFQSRAACLDRWSDDFEFLDRCQWSTYSAQTATIYVYAVSVPGAGFRGVKPNRTFKDCVETGLDQGKKHQMAYGVGCMFVVVGGKY